MSVCLCVCVSASLRVCVCLMHHSFLFCCCRTAQPAPEAEEVHDSKAPPASAPAEQKELSHDDPRRNCGVCGKLTPGFHRMCSADGEVLFEGALCHACSSKGWYLDMLTNTFMCSEAAPAPEADATMVLEAKLEHMRSFLGSCGPLTDETGRTFTFYTCNGQLVQGQGRA